MDNCIVSNSVKIGLNSTVNQRCVIGDEVVIPDGTEVPIGTRLIADRKSEDGFSDDDESDEEGINSSIHCCV